jgi:hypothetical protein
MALFYERRNGNTLKSNPPWLVGASWLTGEEESLRQKEQGGPACWRESRPNLSSADVQTTGGHDLEELSGSSMEN